MGMGNARLTLVCLFQMEQRWLHLPSLQKLRHTEKLYNLNEHSTSLQKLRQAEKKKF